MELTRELVTKALGDVEDRVLAEVLATGASAEELAQARAWVANDESLLNTGAPLPAGRVSRLIEILTSVNDNDQE
jgi:hypothetical protein